MPDPTKDAYSSTVLKPEVASEQKPVEEVTETPDQEEVKECCKECGCSE